MLRLAAAAVISGAVARARPPTRDLEGPRAADDVTALIQADARPSEAHVVKKMGGEKSAIEDRRVDVNVFHTKTNAEEHKNEHVVGQGKSTVAHAQRQGTSYSSSSARRSSSTNRIIFFVGLEGSGHHFIEHLLEHSKPARKLAPKLQPKVEVGCWLVDFKSADDIAELLEEWREDPRDRVFMPSYPCGVGDPIDRMGRLHPRVDLLAEACRNHGIEFKAVLMKREGASSLASTCANRKFASCSEQAYVLASNARILGQHWASLRKHEKLCFEFGNVNAMQKTIVKLFGRDMVPDDFVARMWREPKSLSIRRLNATKFQKQLAQIDKVLENACSNGQHALDLAD